ncbi:hypothetical protein NW762_005417 [Fusarium torreyae]|uniref:Uncharacterized protein n=1 Tax=Fusarium torreyae TaxID=1237075 RepID=A0A9W8S3M8_9HYPO|nr:hypothetical protein NW762_005417 [Fusarium torreyae]
MALRIFRLEPDPEPEPMETGNFLIEISSKGPVKTTETEDGSITIFHYSPTETEVVHFRRHQNAYAAFVIYAGRFQFWNNHLGYNLRVGDFVFVPPPGFSILCAMILAENSGLRLASKEQAFRTTSTSSRITLPQPYTKGFLT